MLFATATIAPDTVFLSFTAGAEQIHRLPSNCHQGECLLARSVPWAGTAHGEVLGYSDAALRMAGPGLRLSLNGSPLNDVIAFQSTYAPQRFRLRRPLPRCARGRPVFSLPLTPACVGP